MFHSGHPPLLRWARTMAERIHQPPLPYECAISSGAVRHGPRLCRRTIALPPPCGMLLQAGPNTARCSLTVRWAGGRHHGDGGVPVRPRRLHPVRGVHVHARHRVHLCAAGPPRAAGEMETQALRHGPRTSAHESWDPNVQEDASLVDKRTHMYGHNRTQRQRRGAPCMGVCRWRRTAGGCCPAASAACWRRRRPAPPRASRRACSTSSPTGRTPRAPS